MNLAQELARSLDRDARIYETHVSWVIVAGSWAYKLKKPLRFPFVDQSTPELRRALCEEEVRVNQPLAAPVVRGVAAIVRGRGGLELGSPGSPEPWTTSSRCAASMMPTLHAAALSRVV